MQTFMRTMSRRVTGASCTMHLNGCRRYGGAVDVERAADLYAQGWTLRQIGAELGVTGPRSAISFAAPGSPCVAAVLPLIPPPHNRSWSCVTKA